MFSLLCSCAFLWLKLLPGSYLHVATGVLDLGKIIRAAGKGLALHELALRHLNSYIVLALGIRREPRQARSLVIITLGVGRDPTLRGLLVDTPRKLVFLSIDTIVL